MRFTNPWILLLFIPLALPLIAHLRRSAAAKAEQCRQALRFSDIAPVKAAGKSLRQHLLPLPRLLIIFALTMTIIALAGPQRGLREIAGKRSGVAIEMLFDISSSMDINLNSSTNNFERIGAAKKVCRDFILGNGKELSGRQNDIIGLITFARYADTACPMTGSLDALAAIVSELEVENRPNEDGTAYGDALTLASARLMKLDEEYRRDGALPVKSKIIILITDGDNNCGRHLPQQAAALAKKWGIKIYAVFLGDRPLKDAAGKPLLSPGQQMLNRICRATGGICRMVYDYDSLEAVYAEIDALEKSRLTSFSNIVYRRIHPWFCAAALAALALAILLQNTLLRRLP